MYQSPINGVVFVGSAVGCNSEGGLVKVLVRGGEVCTAGEDGGGGGALVSTVSVTVVNGKEGGGGGVVGACVAMFESGEDGTS